VEAAASGAPSRSLVVGVVRHGGTRGPLLLGAFDQHGRLVVVATSSHPCGGTLLLRSGEHRPVRRGAVLE